MSGAPTSLLVAEATSSMPGVAAAALTGGIVGVIAARMVLLLERTRLDWAITTVAAAYVGTALSRDSSVQSVATRWIDLADIRLATHISALIGAGAVLWLGLLWRTRTPVTRTMVMGIAACVVALGVILASLSAPARASNIAIEELGTWRTPAYMMVYSLPTPLAEIPALITALALIRGGRRNRSRALFGVIVTTALVVSMTDSASRMASAWASFAGVDNALARQPGSNDWLFLVPVCGVVLLAVPSIVVSATIRLRRDPASRNIAVLTPIWTDLTAARPETQLAVRTRASLPQVREHRMLIEIEDVVLSLAPILGRLGDQPTTTEVCRTLKSALSEKPSEPNDTNTDTDVDVPAWIRDEQFILAVAHEWTRDQDHPPSTR